MLPSTARAGGEGSGNFDKSQQRTADITKTSCLAGAVNCVIIPVAISQHSRLGLFARYLEEDDTRAISSIQISLLDLVHHRKRPSPQPAFFSLPKQKVNNRIHLYSHRRSNRHCADSASRSCLKRAPVIRFIFSHATACQRTKPPPQPSQPCRFLNLPAYSPS